MLMVHVLGDDVDVLFFLLFRYYFDLIWPKKVGNILLGLVNGSQTVALFDESLQFLDFPLNGRVCAICMQSIRLNGSSFSFSSVIQNIVSIESCQF